MKRFYVETSDAFGVLEYDAFDTAADATKLAADLVRDGATYAVAVDRTTYLWLAKFGTCPKDWN